jgi:hypothetical protein
MRRRSVTGVDSTRWSAWRPSSPHFGFGGFRAWVTPRCPVGEFHGVNSAADTKGRTLAGRCTFEEVSHTLSNQGPRTGHQLRPQPTSG